MFFTSDLPPWFAKNEQLVFVEMDTEHLYRRFKTACRERGYNYTLRQIRPKALTDEAILAGAATNKGVHLTDAMRRRYVKKVLPVAVKNNLKRIKKRDEFS